MILTTSHDSCVANDAQGNEELKEAMIGYFKDHILKFHPAMIDLESWFGTTQAIPVDQFLVI